MHPTHVLPNRPSGARGRSASRRLLLVFLGCVPLAGLPALGACIASAPEGLSRITDEGDAGSLLGDAGTPDAKTDLPITDPHAVVGAEPSHGPFTGGQRVLLHGNGFTPDLRVWFGDVEVDPEVVLSVDATRAQVDAPAHAAGVVDLTTQNGDDESTRRTLVAGYSYDTLYADPNDGPVSGGTEIHVHGQGTSWDEATEARVNLKPCTSLTVISPTELLCVVPPGTPGSKTIQVTDGDDPITVLDAYTYEDSDNGFKGGLSGEPLDGTLRVLVYNDFTGDPIPGAHVVVGESMDGALLADVGETGVVEFEDSSLDQPVTVTVAAHCHSPISFVDVPVDTVTVYLAPIMSPACADGGDPPPVGGSPIQQGVVGGELVWEMQGEFQKGNFQVPNPIGPDEKVVAYVFTATSNPSADFILPNATAAITPATPGSVGYGFSITLPPGNRTLYAIAGIENRAVSPPNFTAYSMGLVKGVPVLPGETTAQVYIDMLSTMDLALLLDPQPPAPGPKGPDRLRSSVALQLGSDGFAILPNAQKSPLLPLNGPVGFVGLPLLAGGLLGATYVAEARAVTGDALTAPLSVVGRIVTTTTSEIIPVDGFVGVPTLATPATNTQWDGQHLSTEFPESGFPVDLTVYDISSGNGLVTWTVAVPDGDHAIQLPDIRVFADDAGLPPGAIKVGVYGARIDDFDYTELRYRNLRPIGMTAYSLDFFNSFL